MSFDDAGFSYTPRQEEVLRSVLSSGARHCLLYGGSRSGKTFLLCCAVADRAVLAPGSRHLVLRKHANAAIQSIAMDTMKKVFALKYPQVTVTWRGQPNHYFEIDLGTDEDLKPRPKSEIWIGGVDDAERFDKMLGKEYATIYANEASELSYEIYAQAQSRLAQRVRYKLGSEKRTLNHRMYVDLNPTGRRHWTYQLWVSGIEPVTGQPIDTAQYAYARMNPTDNRLHLGDEYIDSLEALPPEQKRRFFLGEYGADTPNALWARDTIQYSPKPDEPPATLRRVVVSVDPAVSTSIGSDETGIVVVGIDADGVGWVLDDLSGKYEPNEWAKQAVAAYIDWDADGIVAEKNQGGDMVRQVLKQHEGDYSREQLARIPVKLVSAWKGKYLRAEPVAALYARGMVKHLRPFLALEDQMCAFTPDYDRKRTGESPDRLDAMVHGFAELFPRLSQRKEDRRPRRRAPTAKERWI